MKALALDDLISIVRFQLYEAVVRQGLSAVQPEYLAEVIGSDVKPAFVRIALEQLEELKEVKFVPVPGELNLYNKPQPAKLTAFGIRQVEADLRKDNSRVSRYKEEGASAFDEQSFPIASVPAADRVVPLNHNSAEYQKVESSFVIARDAVASINIEEGQKIQRDNILAALDSGQSLWESTELTLLQIKVGILLVADQAQEFAAGTAQALKVAMLVEAIKAFLKTCLGINF